ncbi:hypothetical protein TNIN_334691 [Trichonephila inaurata madagascariensis]|uniref:Uncharacterized protein n=1 Tax=Trichonephila inaurata madagascariensis TaxID=2747483 RepID=A0A8X6YEI9_9ARAC|nr:hypothetical protein TNIN_334691 [Trichonephila inaurata madagascariensis]
MFDATNTDTGENPSTVNNRSVTLSLSSCSGLDFNSQLGLLNYSVVWKDLDCLGASDNLRNAILSNKFTPHFTSNISFTVYVVNIIVGQLPHFSLNPSWSKPFSDLEKLADPTFFQDWAYRYSHWYTHSSSNTKGSIYFHRELAG